MYRLVDNQEHHAQWISHIESNLHFLSARSQNALRRNGYSGPKWVELLTSEERRLKLLLGLRNVGLKSALEINRIVENAINVNGGLAHLTEASEVGEMANEEKSKKEQSYLLLEACFSDELQYLSNRSRNVLRSFEKKGRSLHSLFGDRNTRLSLLLSLKNCGRKSVREIDEAVLRALRNAAEYGENGTDDPEVAWTRLTGWLKLKVESMVGSDTGPKVIMTKGRFSRPEETSLTALKLKCSLFDGSWLGWESDGLLNFLYQRIQSAKSDEEALLIRVGLAVELVCGDAKMETLDDVHFRLRHCDRQERPFVIWFLFRGFGFALEEIGQYWKLSKERVKQIAVSFERKFPLICREMEALRSMMWLYNDERKVFFVLGEDGVKFEVNSDCSLQKAMVFWAVTTEDLCGDRCTRGFLDYWSVQIRKQQDIGECLLEEQVHVFLAERLDSVERGRCLADRLIASGQLKCAGLRRVVLIQLVEWLWHQGKACSFKEISSGLKQGKANDTVVESALRKAIAYGAVISVGKRALYMSRPTWSDSRSVGYYEFARYYLDSTGKSFASLYEIHSAYRLWTGIPRDNVMKSMSIMFSDHDRMADYRMVALPFDHIGTVAFFKQYTGSSFQSSVQQVVSNLRLQVRRLPELDSDAMMKLATRLGKKWGQPAQFVFLALRKRKLEVQGARAVVMPKDLLAKRAVPIVPAKRGRKRVLKKSVARPKVNEVSTLSRAKSMMVLFLCTLTSLEKKRLRANLVVCWCSMPEWTEIQNAGSASVQYKRLPSWRRLIDKPILIEGHRVVSKGKLTEAAEAWLVELRAKHRKAISLKELVDLKS